LRVITENPSDVIPNIVESDRYNNLVIAHIKIPYTGERIACVINTENGNTNWYGSPDLSDPYERNEGCSIWGWSKPRNLLTIIVDSWNDWTINFHDIVKIYICESIQDIIDAFEDTGIKNSGILSDMISKFPRK
jgi:hypothetical protein